MKPDAAQLMEAGIFSEINIAFANLMARISRSDAPELFFAAALASRATSEGHVCFNLADAAGRCLVDLTGAETDLACPKLAAWREILEGSAVVGRPGDYRPLVLDHGSRLYLYRYWNYESRLARSLRHRGTDYADDVDEGILKQGLTALFGPRLSGETDWQKVAVFTAMMKRCCIISGGPGTGKSTVVAKVLSLYARQCAAQQALPVALAAPTGKAAARLREAVKAGMDMLTGDARVSEERIPDATTIHRLLGSISGSPYFRHHAENPVSARMVVVDEASMVDLALMAKLVDALPAGARLILLGDRDQLASVEAGAVLGDICDREAVPAFSNEFADRYRSITGEILPGGGAAPGPGIHDCLVQLQQSYRFGPESGIGALSRAVNRGEGQEAMAILKGGRYADLSWRPPPPEASLKSTLKGPVLRHFGPLVSATDSDAAIELLSGFRVLCAVRKGPYGVEAVNRLVENILQEERLIHPAGRYYHGCPVLIATNDYQKGLFNGDMGVVWKDPQLAGQLRAFFGSPDRGIRSFLPTALPSHETAWAMTVHKGQGSEFGSALLMLPDAPGPLLARELIYTGITRARRFMEIWGRESVFVEAVKRRTLRASGLRDALWGT